MHLESSEHLIRLVAQAAVELLNAGITAKTIAKGTGLSPSTISRFAFRQTIKPQMHTVFAILEYLGFRLTIEREPKGRTHTTTYHEGARA